MFFVIEIKRLVRNKTWSHSEETRKYSTLKWRKDKFIKRVFGWKVVDFFPWISVSIVYLEFKYDLPELSVHVSQRNTIFGFWFGKRSKRRMCFIPNPIFLETTPFGIRTHYAPTNFQNNSWLKYFNPCGCYCFFFFFYIYIMCTLTYIECTYYSNLLFILTQLSPQGKLNNTHCIIGSYLSKITYDYLVCKINFKVTFYTRKL